MKQDISVSMIEANFCFILTFGLFFILAAGGDILILWLLRNVKSSSFVQDHPTRVGCYILS